MNETLVDAMPSCHPSFYFVKVIPGDLAIFQAHHKLSDHTVTLVAIVKSELKHPLSSFLEHSVSLVEHLAFLPCIIIRSMHLYHLQKTVVS